MRLAQRPAVWLLIAAGLAAAPGADARVRAPRGIEVGSYASRMGHPTNLAWDEAGRVWTTSGGYLASRSDGVWFLPRRGARPRHVVRRLFQPLGLTWLGGELYVSHMHPYSTSGPHTGRVVAYSEFDGQRFHRSRVVLDRLPVGLHSVDSVVPGPDGRLYLGIGSRDDVRRGASPSASVVSFEPSGADLRVEARGLRNPFGLAFLPGTSLLLVSDNGRDDLGPRRPPDELNALDVSQETPDFGFPGCPGRSPGGCGGTVRPLARLAPHAAAAGVAVAPAFGPYGPSAFVAENGSTIRGARAGADVVRVALRGGEDGGEPLRGRRVAFARGFRRYDPVGAGIGPDGALYVTLNRSGRILRFAPE